VWPSVLEKSGYKRPVILVKSRLRRAFGDKAKKGAKKSLASKKEKGLAFSEGEYYVYRLSRTEFGYCSTSDRAIYKTSDRSTG
jgi:hypothetical protein